MSKLLQALERFFRHAVVYPLLRLILHNPPFEGTIDIHKVRKLLILRYDRIGDMIVTTPVLRKLKQENPSLYIGVFASPSNAEIIKHNPYVDRIYFLLSNWGALVREVLAIRREKYDVVLNFVFNQTTAGAILSRLAAPGAIKIGHGAEKYGFHFNRLLNLSRHESHMAEILASFIKEVFGISFTEDDLVFEIKGDADSKRVVDNFLTTNSLARRPTLGGEEEKKYVVFNLSAADDERNVSMEQAVALTRYLTTEQQLATVLLCSPENPDFKSRVAQQVSSPRCHLFPHRGRATLLQIASLIEGAILVVTPDTSIVHFASTTGTPLLGLFTSGITNEWMPYRVPHEVVRAPEGLPVSAIPVRSIIDRAEKLMHSLHRKEKLGFL